MNTVLFGRQSIASIIAFIVLAFNVHGVLMAGGGSSMPQGNRESSVGPQPNRSNVSSNQRELFAKCAKQAFSTVLSRMDEFREQAVQYVRKRGEQLVTATLGQQAMQKVSQLVSKGKHLSQSVIYGLQEQFTQRSQEQENMQCQLHKARSATQQMKERLSQEMLETSWNQMKVESLQKKVRQFESQVSTLESLVEEMAIAQEASHCQQMQDNEQQLLNQIATLQQSLKQSQQAYRKQQGNLKQKLVEISRCNQQEKETLCLAHQKEKKALTKRLSKTQAAVSTAQASVDQCCAKIAQLTQENKQLLHNRATRDATEQVIQQERQQREAAQQQVSQAQQTTEQMRQLLAQQQATAHKTAAELQAENQRICQEFQRVYAQQKQFREQSKTQLKGLQAKVVVSQKEIVQLKQKNRELLERIAAFRVEGVGSEQQFIAGLQEQLQERDAEVEQLRMKLKQAEQAQAATAPAPPAPPISSILPLQPGGAEVPAGMVKAVMQDRKGLLNEIRKGTSLRKITVAPKKESSGSSGYVLEALQRKFKLARGDDKADDESGWSSGEDE